MNITYRFYIKPLLDRFFAISLLICLSPLVLILAFLIRCLNGSPILFKQARPGFKEKIFTIYKFRTMNDKKDCEGKPLSDIERTTRFGKFLRATSLDELPELLNILKGEMSFVGPRPLLVKYLPLYDDVQKRRHSVKPGLTGLAQINGRNDISWEKRFEYDVFYVDNLSFKMDLKIVLRTFLNIVSGDGANESETFLGSAKK